MERKEKSTEVNEHIDYKDVVRLRAYMNAHARMMSRTRTAMSAHEQRKFAEAVKRARFMALLPYVTQ
jgi:small subunit ribosomal protein S18